MLSSDTGKPCSFRSITGRRDKAFLYERIMPADISLCCKQGKWRKGYNCEKTVQLGG